MLNTSHISTRKVRNEILAQMKVLGALALPSGKAGFITGSHLTLFYPQWALLDFLQFLLNCHLTGSQGRKENRWEKFLMHMGWYLKQSLCPGMGVLQAESPIPVWEAGSSLPEETCLVLQGEVTSLPSHLFWKCLIQNELTLPWVVPGSVTPVLPLLSKGHQAEDAAAQFYDPRNGCKTAAQCRCSTERNLCWTVPKVITRAPWQLWAQPRLCFQFADRGGATSTNGLVFSFCCIREKSVCPLRLVPAAFLLLSSPALGGSQKLGKYFTLPLLSKCPRLSCLSSTCAMPTIN